MEKLLTDQTLYGRYNPGGKPWAEYQSPDGRTAYKEENCTYAGHWWIQDDLVCYRYDPSTRASPPASPSSTRRTSFPRHSRAQWGVVSERLYDRAPAGQSGPHAGRRSGLRRRLEVIWSHSRRCGSPPPRLAGRRLPPPSLGRNPDRPPPGPGGALLDRRDNGAAAVIAAHTLDLEIQHAIVTLVDVGMGEAGPFRQGKVNTEFCRGLTLQQVEGAGSARISPERTRGAC